MKYQVSIYFDSFKYEAFDKNQTLNIEILSQVKNVLLNQYINFGEKKSSFDI